MNALERAQLIKVTFIQESINNGFTESQAKGFFDIIIEYIEKLKNVRLNEKLTNKILDELINLSDIWESSKEESYFLTATKFSHIMSWLYKLILDDKTYWYAKLRIAQHNSQKTRMSGDNIEERYVTQKEIEELILKEEPKPIYRVRDDKKMEEIHQLLDKEVINCNPIEFIAGIEAADFNNIKIMKLDIVKDLTYRLKGIMGNIWYTDICKNMNWEKPKVSGKRKKLERILPRPQK
jgi:hypothetical protein